MRAILNLLFKKKTKSEGLQPMKCTTWTPNGWDGTWKTAEKGLDELRASFRDRIALEKEMLIYRQAENKRTR